MLVTLTNDAYFFHLTRSQNYETFLSAVVLLLDVRAMLANGFVSMTPNFCGWLIVW